MAGPTTQSVTPPRSADLRERADRLFQSGDHVAADQAYLGYVAAATDDPELMQAGAALMANQLAVAERLLKDRLKRYPTDIAAIRMLAELATRIGRYGDAVNLLTRCLELAPSFEAARHNYAVALHRQGRAEAAVVQVDRLLIRAPDNPNYAMLKAAALVQIGEYSRAIEVYEPLLRRHPDIPTGWMSYGHALKTSGRRDDCIAAYRRAIAGAPQLGEVYWSLANMKTFQFDAIEIAAMGAQLRRTDLTPEDRLHFHFALGKAHEDLNEYGQAFEHYAEGNRIRRAQIDYSADENAEHTRRAIAFFTPELFAAHRGSGAPDPDPIFIVGLPRSGSTLIEQILSSHSQVEGTMELPDLSSIARDIGGRRKHGDPTLYPEILGGFTDQQLRQLGEEYLRRTRIQRKSDRPYFIDKMPHNFLYAGMIRLIMPNAKIIDARRHPLGTCFSAFKQHFARGQTFSYELTELGRYYRDYVELMAHMDRALPGMVHRVDYEVLVDNAEREVARLLDYCSLPFEAGCLQFHENPRAVRTASAEQVRQPLYRDGVDHWRNFTPWLGPLRDALGPVLGAIEDLPAVTARGN